MNYLKEIIKGVSWMALLRGSTRLIGLIKIAVLARIFTPDQFGTIGIALLSLSLLETLTETGINVFFIQKGGSVKKYINTAWVISIFRGILISLLILALSPFIAAFFNSPESQKIMIAVSLIPVLRGLVNPALVKLQKDLKFNKEFIIRFTIYIIEVLVSILFSLITKSIISVVYGLIAGTVVEIFFSFILVKVKPRFELNIKELMLLLKRGKWTTISGISNYLFYEGDDLVVGKLLGIHSLGIYQMFYKISTLPIREVGEIFNKVLFPVYSSINKEKVKIKIVFAISTGMILIFVLLLGTIILIFPQKFIYYTLGSNWLGYSKLLIILTCFGVIRAFTGSVTTLILSYKKQEYVAIITTCSTICLALLIIPLTITGGIMGAAIAPLISSLLVIPIIIFMLNKILR